MTTRKAIPPLVPVHGKSIEAIMRARGLAQADVAKRARLSKATLNYVVVGRNRRMRKDERDRLARVLGVPVARLEGAKPTTWQEASQELADDPTAIPSVIYQLPYFSRAKLEANALHEMLARRGVDAPVNALYARLMCSRTWRALLRQRAPELPTPFHIHIEDSDEGEFAARVMALIRMLDAHPDAEPGTETETLDPTALHDLARCHQLFLELRRAKQGFEGARAAALALLQSIGEKLAE